MSDYESLRARHTELFHHLRPEYLARLGWTREMLQQHRTRELRKVLAIAKAHAPAYRQRLANVDPVTATEADLARIQPLTKDELMNDFENFLTDRRLSRELVESHLTNLTDDAYLLDEFHVAESSGSSGRRGVFVYGWDAWPVFFLTLVRFRLRYQRAHPYIWSHSKARSRRSAQGSLYDLRPAENIPWAGHRHFSGSHTAASRDR